MPAHSWKRSEIPKECSRSSVYNSCYTLLRYIQFLRSNSQAVILHYYVETRETWHPTPVCRAKIQYYRAKLVVKLVNHSAVPQSDEGKEDG